MLEWHDYHNGIFATTELGAYKIHCPDSLGKREIRYRHGGEGESWSDGAFVGYVFGEDAAKKEGSSSL